MNVFRLFIFVIKRGIICFKFFKYYWVILFGDISNGFIYILCCRDVIESYDNNFIIYLYVYLIVDFRIGFLWFGFKICVVGCGNIGNGVMSS